MSHADAPNAIAEPRPLAGVLVEFEQEHDLIEAARKVREAGYTRFDAHSPYPVHGIDSAMGIQLTKLGWVVFACGLIGATAGVVLQYWTNAAYGNQPLPQWITDNVPNWSQPYPFRISGKPFFSLPANIPVIFELTVLLAAFGAVFGMFIMNNLPWFYSAFFTSRRFLRATSDRFLISIPAADPKFSAQQTASFAATLGGAVEEVYDADTPAPPRWFRWAIWIGVALLLVPPALIAKGRADKQEMPRIRPLQDMANQPRYKAQQVSPLFADGRAMRPKVVGTVARGDWPIDEQREQGFRYVRDAETDQLRADYFDGYPDGVEISLETLREGQQRFNIYCAVCHGYDGHGGGIVHQRAIKLSAATTGWAPPTDLMSDSIRNILPDSPRPNGHLFNTITNGIRTMPSYGAQIRVEDRWKIIAYIRAMQRATAATLDDVPAELRTELR